MKNFPDYLVKETIDHLNKGNIILYPTDTVWGIGCNALNEASVKRIYTIKNRPKNKSFIILLSNPQDIFQYVSKLPKNIISILENQNTPTTIIYSDPIGLPSILINSDNSIAIRVTKNKLCQQLIEGMKAPLVSTSANLSGVITDGSFHNICEEIKNKVDYILPDGHNEIQTGKPSRILKLNQDGSFLIIRDE